MEDEPEEFRLSPAVIEPLDELVQVAGHVLLAHAVEGPEQPPLGAYLTELLLLGPA